jgi:hypothetical protein
MWKHGLVQLGAASTAVQQMQETVVHQSSPPEQDTAQQAHSTTQHSTTADKTSRTFCLYLAMLSLLNKSKGAMCAAFPASRLTWTP